MCVHKFVGLYVYKHTRSSSHVNKIIKLHKLVPYAFEHKKWIKLHSSRLLERTHDPYMCVCVIYVYEVHSFVACYIHYYIVQNS